MALLFSFHCLNALTMAARCIAKPFCVCKMAEFSGTLKGMANPTKPAWVPRGLTTPWHVFCLQLADTFQNFPSKYLDPSN